MPTENQQIMKFIIIFPEWYWKSYWHVKFCIIFASCSILVKCLHININLGNETFTFRKLVSCKLLICCLFVLTNVLNGLHHVEHGRKFLFSYLNSYKSCDARYKVGILILPRRGGDRDRWEKGRGEGGGGSEKKIY